MDFDVLSQTPNGKGVHTIKTALNKVRADSQENSSFTGYSK